MPACGARDNVRRCVVRVFQTRCRTKKLAARADLGRALPSGPTHHARHARHVRRLERQVRQALEDLDLDLWRRRERGLLEARYEAQRARARHVFVARQRAPVLAAEGLREVLAEHLARLDEDAVRIRADALDVGVARVVHDWLARRRLVCDAAAAHALIRPAEALREVDADGVDAAALRVCTLSARTQYGQSLSSHK